MKKTITKFFTLFKIIVVFLLIISCGEEITKPNQPPTVTITGGPSGTINTNQATFSWSGSDTDGTISGYYYDLDDSTPDTWTTSTSKTLYNLSNGSHTFYVKAKDNDGDYSVIASSSFVVDLPIIVTEPTSSTVWTMGQQNVSIAWDTGNLGGDVDIRLYKGSTYDVIAYTTVNDGSFNYNIPITLEAGSNYRVRVYNDASHYDYSEYFTINEETGNITVTEPTGSTVWTTGQQNVSITWDTGNLGGSVDISLYKGSSLVETIITSISNDGSFNSYDVTNTLTTGSDYRIKVYYDASYYDYSEYFTINEETGNITVTEPTGSTVWTMGDQNVTISWNTGNLGGYVNIRLYQGSTYVDEITSSTSNDGSYNSYDVPTTLSAGTNYRVRVYYDDSHYDYSDYFTINEETGDIVVTEPTGSTVWTMGQQNVSITWNTGNLGGYVNIRLYQGSTYVDEITSSTSNDGSYNSYDVPTTLSAGTNYRVRVYYDDSHYDYSDYFTINEETGDIVVTEPTSSTVWTMGDQNVTISWETGNLGGYVRIRLYKGGTYVDEIVNSTSNDGSYNYYDVPTTLTSGSDYRVNVYLLNIGNNDYSDYFTINQQTGNIAVTEPTGSTVWTMGDQNVTISWDTGNLGGTVNIRLYQGTTYVDEITSSTSNDGSYNYYDVPTTLIAGSNYRVRVYFDASHYDYSEYFTINEEPFETAYIRFYHILSGNWGIETNISQWGNTGDWLIGYRYSTYYYGQPSWSSHHGLVLQTPWLIAETNAVWFINDGGYGLVGINPNCNTISVEVTGQLESYSNSVFSVETNINNCPEIPLSFNSSAYQTQETTIPSSYINTSQPMQVRVVFRDLSERDNRPEYEGLVTAVKYTFNGWNIRGNHTFTTNIPINSFKINDKN